MIHIKDSANNLIWVNYFDSKSTQKKTFWDHFKKSSSSQEKDLITPTLTQTFKELESWESEDISKFILPNSSEKLGSHIYGKYFDEKKEILPEHSGKTFKLWVAFDEKNPTNPTGLTLFSFDKFSEKTYIEYIVVNPDRLREGNGTRMLKSIREISTQKMQNSEDKNLYTFIRKDNIASLNLFKKFGFNPIKMEYIDGLTDDILDSPYYPLLADNFFSHKDKGEQTPTK